MGRLRQYQATLTAAVNYARASRLVVHVVLPREPGVAEQARQAAEQAGVRMTTEIWDTTMSFRFAVPPAIVAAESVWSCDEQVSPN